MGFRIGQICAVVSVGADGEEGVAAAMINGAWTPLIAADERRLGQIRVMGKELARATGMQMRLVRFDCRTDVEDITP